MLDLGLGRYAFRVDWVRLSGGCEVVILSW
jgi:hypothetical protein